MDHHRAELEELQEKDPAFYKFLKEQDADLLEFNESDYEMDEAEGGDEGEEKTEEEVEKEEVKLGEVTISLKVDNEDRLIVNKKLADALEEALAGKKENRVALREAVNLAIKLFQSSASRIGVKIDELEYVIYSNKVSDSIAFTCLNHMSDSLRFLMHPINRKSTAKKASTSFKYWKKFRSLTKVYLQTLVMFMTEVDQGEALTACIDSAAELTDMFVHFPKICRLLMKILVKVWSRKSIDERKSAFNVIKKLSMYDSKHFTTIYKKCYLAYVSVSRNVSSNSWKNLLFMQRTFSELTYLNPDASYQLVFSYIRQLAIHLRNAKIAKRKDLIKSVYNWQYVLGLYLWASVLVYGNDHKEEFDGVEWINELVYNLIQITIGLIGVFSAPRFVPLRLHCIRILLQIQVHCGMFIPTLSLAADCLNDLIKIDKTKPSQEKAAQKITEIRNLIQLKNEMIEDVNYRRKVAKEVVEVLTDAAQVIKEDPAFFEVYIPVKVTLKNFLRNCKNVEHKKMFKAFEQVIQGQDQDLES